MKIGFIGLGKMGSKMVERLLQKGHNVTVFNRSPEPVKIATKKGAIAAASRENLIAELPSPKIIWLMVPSGNPVDENISELAKIIAKGDIIVDGGNSYWHDSQARSARLKELGVHFIDCGVSGGIWGLEKGYCLMYGGDKEACGHLTPVFSALAPDNGHLYCGTSGAGHFVKMIHNGIEYGMMQAYAEGFEIMRKAPFDIDLRAVSNVWQQGSVVRSWLLELIERALAEDPDLEKLKAFVQDSGEGRWAVQTAIELGVPAPVTAHSLFARFGSREEDSFALKLLAALRNQFGGHAIKTNQKAKQK